MNSLSLAFAADRAYIKIKETNMGCVYLIFPASNNDQTSLALFLPARPTIIIILLNRFPLIFLDFVQ